MTKHRHFYQLTTAAVVLAWFVVMMGAYTRLTDAGLGCPDWPGCYGKLIVQKMSQPDFHTSKAWTEMIHRYMAGGLATLIFFIFAMSAKNYADYRFPKLLPCLLVVTVIFQALLGMWTVTWRLLPEVVSAHLIGGFTTLALLWCLRLQIKDIYSHVIDSFAVRASRYVWGGFLLLIIQIVLGAWVSTNYAALSCGNSFPDCNGAWPFPTHLSQVFIFSHSVGPNYSGGLLSVDQRMMIHMVHRFWGLFTASYLLVLSLLFIIKSIQLRRVAMRIILLVLLQVMLGIANVVFLLPLPIAVLHNGVAALLLLAVTTLVYATAHARNRLNV